MRQVRRGGDRCLTTHNFFSVKLLSDDYFRFWSHRGLVHYPPYGQRGHVIRDSQSAVRDSWEESPGLQQPRTQSCSYNVLTSPLPSPTPDTIDNDHWYSNFWKTKKAMNLSTWSPEEILTNGEWPGTDIGPIRAAGLILQPAEVMKWVWTFSPGTPRGLNSQVQVLVTLARWSSDGAWRAFQFRDQMFEKHWTSAMFIRKIIWKCQDVFLCYNYLTLFAIKDISPVLSSSLFHLRSCW